MKSIHISYNKLAFYGCEIDMEIFISDISFFTRCVNDNVGCLYNCIT